MPKIRCGPTLVGVLIVTAIIIVGPFITEPGYSSISHPISQLAAQDTRNAWLMQIGLAALGIGPGIDAVRRLRCQPVRAVFFLIFAAAMIVAAAYKARPVAADLAFDVEEDRIHAVAAIAAGYAFSLGALCFAVTDRGVWRRLASVVAAAAASFIPVLMFMYPEFLGLLQRVMLATCFAWLVVFLPVNPERQASGR